MHKYKKELLIFTIIGIFSVFIDFSTYIFMTNVILHKANFAKTLGFINGILFSYFCSKKYIFNSSNTIVKDNLWKFIFVYIISLFANIEINSLALMNINFHHNFNVILSAFLLATTSSAIINFLGIKFFIFNTNASIKI